MMNVDLMRVVDKWIGVPLCFLLTLVDKLLRMTKRPMSQRAAIHKILFIQLSEMGSTISAYSAIRKAQEAYPEARVYYCIFEDMKGGLELLDVIPREQLFTISSTSLPRFALSTVRTLLAIRREGIDATLDLELFSRASSILSYLCGARIRVGFNAFHMEGLYRGGLETHRVLYNHLNHISQNFLALVYALGESPKHAPFSKRAKTPSDLQLPKLGCSPEQKQNILQKLQRHCPELTPDKKLILLNPNGSDLLPLRRWPMRNYIALTELLLSDPSRVVVVTGSPSERKDAAMICDAIHDSRCINFAGETSLRELIDLYNVSTLLVSNDSGPPNFASLTNLKVLVFFGPESPVCYKPLGENVEVIYADFLCSPCVSAYNHRKSACKDNKCLQAIEPSRVYARIQDLL